MTSTFEKLVKELQAEHHRQLRELIAEISELRNELKLASEIPKGPCTAYTTSSSGSSQAIGSGRGTTRCSKKVEVSQSNDSKASPGFFDVGSHELHQRLKRHNSYSDMFDTQGRHSAVSTSSAIPRFAKTSDHARHLLFSKKPHSNTFACEAVAHLHRTASRPLHKSCIESSYFESAIGLLIVVSALVTATELQLDGMTTGHRLGISGYKPAEEVWPGANKVLAVVDVVLCSIFVLEFAIRTCLLRLRIFFSVFNYLDCLVVISTLIDWFMSGSSNSNVLRVIRLIKLSRAFRTLKMHRFMAALQLLLTSIYASVSTLFWALVVIMCTQVITAMILTQVMAPYYERTDKTQQALHDVFAYFGTFTRSLMTVFEVLLANWATPCRVLVKNVGEEYGFIIVGYRCICGFAVLSVVQAVFLQQTMKVMSQDSEIMILEKRRNDQRYHRRLNQLFERLDISGDGVVTLEEMSSVLNHDEVKMHCYFLGIDPSDLEDVFRLVDAGQGVLLSDFIEAARQVRRQAGTIDMARVLANSRKMQILLRDIEVILSSFFSAWEQHTYLLEQQGASNASAQSTACKETVLVRV